MRTHRLVSLTRTDERLRLVIVAVSVILLACLLANLDGSSSAQLGLPATQTTCTGTFAGHWTSQQGGTLAILLKGDAADGVLRSSVKLRGKVTNGVLVGDWVDQVDPGASGTFRAELFPAEHRLRLGLYNKQKLVNNSDWFCQSSRSQSSSPSPLPPSPSPIQIPTPTPDILGHDGRDIDHFVTFDALPKAEQEAMLIKRGPRVEKEYQLSQIEMRVFVKGGLPIIVDYGLSSDAPAYLSIGAGGDKPFLTRLEPARLTQVRITVPDHFGPDRQVGKLRIIAYTSRKEPANFQLYGIAFGEAGTHALNNLIPVRPNALRSVLGFASRAESAVESLFEPIIPQDDQPIVISVSPPLTIQSPKKRPRKFITFSLTSRSLYDNGCWELQYMDAGSRSSRWQKDTGTIRPNKRKSEKWDGIISVQKLVLAGDYELRVRAWRGDEGDAVIVSALSNLTVIE
jgi:hypothetical protein